MFDDERKRFKEKRMSDEISISHVESFSGKKACRQLHWISELYTQLLLGQNPSLLSQGPRWLQDKSLHTYIVLREMETSWMRLKMRMNEWMNLSHFPQIGFRWIYSHEISFDTKWKMRKETEKEKTSFQSIRIFLEDSEVIWTCASRLSYLAPLCFSSLEVGGSTVVTV